LTGKVALVTGGARGIGRGIAVAFAQHGADVAVVDRAPPDKIAPVLDEIRALSRRALGIQQDLANLDQLDALAENVWQAFGKVDILANIAGIAAVEHFADITPARWRKILAVNLDAPFFLCKAIAIRMARAKIAGRIINMSSLNAYLGSAGLTHYNASKAGLEQVTRTLAIELGEYGINVNSINPGNVETDIGEEFKPEPGFMDYYREHIPLGHRIAKVEDIVGAAVFLASPASRFMTGQHIIVDGGLSCQHIPRCYFLSQHPIK
jgi:glucose 1-dehydrogenase/gluconate 5-dehydrogenase